MECLLVARCARLRIGFGFRLTVSCIFRRRKTLDREISRGDAQSGLGPDFQCLLPEESPIVVLDGVGGEDQSLFLLLLHGLWEVSAKVQDGAFEGDLNRFFSNHGAFHAHAFGGKLREFKRIGQVSPTVAVLHRNAFLAFRDCPEARRN